MRKQRKIKIKLNRFTCERGHEEKHTWNSQLFERHIRNNLFSILPWKSIRYLASPVLSLSLKQVQKDRESRFGVRSKLTETFVYIRQYRDTCYNVVNWIMVFERIATWAAHHPSDTLIHQRRACLMIWTQTELDRYIWIAFHLNMLLVMIDARPKNNLSCIRKSP